MDQSLDQSVNSAFYYLNKDAASVDKLKQQKPYMRGACAPGRVYRDHAHFNPKHLVKLYQIEDVI